MKKPIINYHQIYSDILENRFPQRKAECMHLLKKKDLSAIDIITLNRKIFGITDEETESFNQKHRSYGKRDILQILDYQHSHRLNNTQLANHFKLSRNTVTKWRRIFL